MAPVKDICRFLRVGAGLPERNARYAGQEGRASGPCGAASYTNRVRGIRAHTRTAHDVAASCTIDHTAPRASMMLVRPPALTNVQAACCCPLPPSLPPPGPFTAMGPPPDSRPAIP